MGSYPTINIRNLGPRDPGFPEMRYFSPANTVGGIVLVAANLTGDNEFRLQWQLLKLLRPHAERFKDRLRFTIVERTKKTRELRKFWGIGVDSTYDTELLLIDDFKWGGPTDLHAINFYHG